MTTFNPLNPSRMIHLFDQTRFKIWQAQNKEIFKKGEQISYPYKLSNEIYLIIKGNVRIFHIHRDGKECVLGILSAGDFIDFSSVFTEKESHAYSIALTDVTVVKVPKKEIIEEVIQTPELSYALLNYFSNQLRDVVFILEQVAYDKVEERLLKMMKKLTDPAYEKDGWYPLPPYITHKDLAGMIASTRETVTFLMNKLIQDKMVQQRQNRLWLAKDPPM